MCELALHEAQVDSCRGGYYMNEMCLGYTRNFSAGF